jgi:hypothetical protein
MLLVESLLASSAANPAGPVYVEDVFNTQLYDGTGILQAIPAPTGFAGGATSPGWVASLGGATGTKLETVDMTVDSSGNFYICSNYFAAGDTTASSYAVAKYNSNGVFQWIRFRDTSSTANTATAIAVEPGGDNVYVVGSQFTPDLFDNEAFLAKIDSNGNFVWERRVTWGNSEVFLDVAVDSGNNVIACGYDFDSVASTNRAVVMKFNSSGTFTWGQSYTPHAGTGIQRFNAVAIDSSNDIYLAGTFNPASGRNYRVIKYNSSGTMQWQGVSTLATTGTGFTNIAVGPNGDVHALGVGSTSNSIVYARYTSTGTLLYRRQIANASATIGPVDIVVDSNSNFYIYATTQISGEQVPYISKYDNTAVNLWQRIYAPSPNITSSGGVGVQVDSTGNVYLLTSQSDSNNSTNAFFSKLPGDGSGLAIYTVNTGSFAYAPASLADTSAVLGTSTVPAVTSTRSVTNTTVTYTSISVATSTFTTSTTAVDAAGGLVWIKQRNAAANHALYDTARGATLDLFTNGTDAQTTQTEGVTSFLSNGFTIGTLAKVNTSGNKYGSWQFREQPGFFDIVTYTGNGTNRTIRHNLQSVPGCIVVKATSGAADWQVYHRSLAATEYAVLNSTAAAATGASRWNSTAPTTSEFSLGTDSSVNANGVTYVAYLFAHDAGGFGATGTDNVISCGSYTGNGSTTGPAVTLDWEPQWLLVKRATGGTGDWNLIDNMRGFSLASIDAEANPNLDAFDDSGAFAAPTATGFRIRTNNAGYNANGSTYIYIAIRRGPMRTPTTGISVFSPIASSATTGTKLTTDFPVDAQIFSLRTGTTNKGQAYDRLRGISAVRISGAIEQGQQLLTNSTAAETSATNTYNWDNTGFLMPTNFSGTSTVFWNFRRAPGFFDVVGYTGTAASATFNHNLGVVPELMVFKRRNGVTNWAVYTASTGATKALYLDDSSTGLTSSTFFNNTTPTSSVFSVGTGLSASGGTYVAYLFASCPGVSKVGSYTGTGATQTVNCGFTGGARFVLIKRTDSTGNWICWDTARGIIAGNDPYLIWNAPAAAEVTNTDWVDTAASGFELSAAVGNLANTSGGSYIFLAIA